MVLLEEMPEVPEGWTATTSLAEPYSDTFSPGASLSSPRDFRGWTDKADIEEWKEEVNRTSISPRSFTDIFM